MRLVENVVIGAFAFVFCSVVVIVAALMLFVSGPIFRGRLRLASSSRCCLRSSSAFVVSARALTRASQQHCPCCRRVACAPRLSPQSQTGYGVRSLRRFLVVVGSLGSRVVSSVAIGLFYDQFCVIQFRARTSLFHVASVRCICICRVRLRFACGR